MKILKENWFSNFVNELKKSKDLKIISPFIGDNMVDHLINNWNGNAVQVITRFNLNDFRSGVSSIRGLKKLVENGAMIKGIQGLHSKAYIFDTKTVIITSANFTNGGFFNNYELGIKSDVKEEVNESLSYFNYLWSFNNSILDFDTIVEWENIISKNKITLNVSNLEDCGTSIIKKIIGNKNYFIKFYGTADDRANWDENVDDLIDGTHCHFAVTFPEEIGRPIRYNEGDIVYMARMIDNGEYAIFGKAIARKHDRIRDVASEEDKKQIKWKKYYPIYIRVHSGEFLNTTFKNCPKMGIMMSELGYECFRSTKKRHENGEHNINPRLVLKQKPDVWLSEEGAFWVEQKFQDAKKKYSLIEQSFIDDLYQGNPIIK